MANLLLTTVVTAVLQACVVAGYFQVIHECDYRFSTRWKHCFNGGRCVRHVLHMGYGVVTGQDDVTYEIGAVCECGGTGHHGDSCQISGETDAWFTAGYQQYQIINRRANTNTEAQSLCAGIKGHVAVPKNKAENEILANMNVSGMFVIGVNDVITEGTWTYDLDGSVITWSYWMNWTNGWMHEPTGGMPQDCAVMLTTLNSHLGGFVRGGWADVPCGHLGVPATQVVCQRDPQYTVLMCEDNSWIDMACHYDERPEIEIVSAFYGRRTNDICPNVFLNKDLNCASDVTQKIAAKCNGHRRTCSPRISSTYLGDPCPGKNKYLEVVYRCIPATSTPSPPTTPQPTAPGPNWIVINGKRYAVFEHPVTSLSDAWQLCLSHSASLPIPKLKTENDDLAQLNAKEFFLGYFHVKPPGSTYYTWLDTLHNHVTYHDLYSSTTCGNSLGTNQILNAPCVVFGKEAGAHSPANYHWTCLPCDLSDGSQHPPVPQVVCVADATDEQGWITKGKKQYKVFDYSVTSFGEARSVCFENGAILPEPHGPETQYLASLNVPGPFPLGISAPCGPGFTARGGACYLPSTYPVTHEQAVKNCKNINAFLVEPRNAEENRIVKEIMDEYKLQNCWLGLTDLPLKDSNFKWASNGDALSWAYWEPEQPNHYEGKQHCVNFEPGQGGWNDAQCTNPYTYICESAMQDANTYNTWLYDSDGTKVKEVFWNQNNPSIGNKETCVMFGLEGGYDTHRAPAPLAYGWENVGCDLRSETVPVEHLVCERALSAAPVDGWMNIGNKQYKIFPPQANGTSYRDAHYVCSKNDAKVPEPRNQEENDNLARLPTTAFYLGMKDNLKSGTLYFSLSRKWNYNSDKTEVQFFQWTKWTNHDHEPDNENNVEHCVLMMKTFYSNLAGHTQGGWGDISCDRLQDYQTNKQGGIVCQRDGWLDNFVYANKQYRVFHPTQNVTSFDGAKKLCAEHYAILPEPMSVEENKALVSLDSTAFYLGMKERADHEWFWNSGSQVAGINWYTNSHVPGYANWHQWSIQVVDPANTCAIMLKDFYSTMNGHIPGGWAENRCEQLVDYPNYKKKGGIVCQRDDWVYDPQSHKTYKVFQPTAAITSRHHAFDICYQHGAKLPQPLNQHENDFLGKLISTAFYLGISGDFDQNWWVWDGTQARISFNRFYSWKGPKDFQDITGHERCVMMIKDFYTTTIATFPGLTPPHPSDWMAVRCDELQEFHMGRQGVVVCERDWYPVGDYEYIVIREPASSHDEARDICLRQNHAVLPEPRSKRENDIIANKLGVTEIVVLGITDNNNEGRWQYDSGPGVAYENWIEWSPGHTPWDPEPNGDDGENCAVMLLDQQSDPHFTRGQWFDDDCHLSRTAPQVVCQRDRSPADLSTPAPLPVVG